MNRPLFALCALLWLATGCPAATDCECAEAEFCCLGTCLALGSTCPPTDAPPGDALLADVQDGALADAPLVDCGPRSLPGGGSTTSLSRCMGDAIWYCSGTPTACNAGYECVEWLDTMANQYRASCVDAGRAPCDPAISASCDGELLVLCAATGRDPTDAPPGLTVTSNCPDVFGEGSTCEADGTSARCTTTACDESTFVSACEGDRFATCMDGALRYQTCVSTLQCLFNDLTAPNATCIPRGAPESATRSATFQVLGCTGDLLLVSQWGYQWGEACDGGQACRGTGAGARCRAADAVPCDVASFVPTCATDILENRCVDGFIEVRYCGISLLSGSVPSACDASTGACVPTMFCGTAPDVCDPTSRYRLRCDPTHGREVAEPCPGCRIEAGAVACD